MGMAIVTAKVRNNGSMIYCLGNTDLIPGAPAKDVDKSLLEHFEVKDAIDKGHLTIIEGGAGENTEPEPKALADMTIPELKAYAAEKQIDIAGISKKEEILAAIQKVEAGE